MNSNIAVLTSLAADLRTPGFTQRGTAPLKRIPLVVAALAAIALYLFAASAAAAPLKMSATPTTVVPGDPVVVQYSVGRHPAKLVLLFDGRQLKTVTVRRSRGRATLTVPGNAAAGPHRLTACVKRACRSLSLRVGRRATAGSGPSPVAAPAGSPQPPPSPPAGPPSGPPPAVGDFTGEPNPLDVEAHTDASRRATATIGMAGGTLETTGADGSRYRLTVPPGALLSDERISITPISSVEGLPFSGGLTAGVQLEPSGLRFSDFVTLEILDHPPLPAQQETGFLYQQDGVEFQLYPVQESVSTTRFDIIHFSGVGIASATEAERNAQLLRATTDVEGRLYQQLARYFRPDGIDNAGVEATLRAYHDQALKPLITAALTDDGLAAQAVNRYFAFARMIALLDYEDFMVAERQALREQWIEIMKNGAIKAYRRCVDESRPEELPAILAWWRNLWLLGESLPVDLWTAVSSCARFELDFRTKIVQEHEGNFEGPAVWRGEAFAENLFIEPDPETLQQSGTKLAQYVDFRVDIPPHKPGTGCWLGGDEWETEFPFTVSRLEMDLNPIQRPDGTYGYPQLERGAIALSVMPFSVREHHIVVDCGSSTGTGAWGMWLAPTFYSLHEDQQDDFGGIVFTNWTVPAGGGSLLGAKTYFRTATVDGHETREETTLELYHAPRR